MPGTPARIDEFPLPIVDLDGVPSVGAVFGWDRLARLERGEACAFAVTRDDKRFEAGFGGDGSEETCVAFTDSEASGEGIGRCRWFYGVVAKGDNVVCNVVVKPSKDSAGLVGVGLEWGGKLSC